MRRHALLHCDPVVERAQETQMPNPWRLLTAAPVSVALFAAAAQLSNAFGASEGSPEVWKVCEGQDGASTEARIEACTVVIDRGVMENDDNRAGAYANRASAFVDKGELDRALQDYIQAIKLDGKLGPAFLGRADVFVAKGQFEFAVLDYGQAIKLNPKNTLAYLSRGSAYSMAGQYDRAIADFDQVIRTNPKDYAAYNNRCFARAKAGQAQLALADCDEALQLRPYDADNLDTR